jgi:MFS family permease
MLLDGILSKLLTTNKARGWAALVGSMMLDISVGEFNLLSFLYPYMSSYFHHFDKEITPRNMSLIASVWLLGLMLMAPLSVFIYNKLGFRLTFLVFVIMFYLGQLICSLVTNFYLFCLLYGLLGGCGQGGLYILPLYCCWRYFPASYRSFISGTILSAYALAPFGTSMIALMIVNPENKAPVKDGEFSYFQADVHQNVPRFLRIFGTFCFILGICGILLIIEPLDEEEGSEISAEDQQDAGSPRIQRIRVTYNKEYEISAITWDKAKSIITDTCFKHFYLIMFIGFLYPHYMLLNFKQIGLEKLPAADRFINIVGSIGLVINASARMVMGIIHQRYGAKPAAWTLIFIMISSAYMFIPLSDTHLLFTLQLWYFEFGYGGLLGFFPLLNHDLYSKDGAMAYSLVFSGFTISCLAVSFLQGVLSKLLGAGLLVLILGIISLVPIPSWYKIFERLEANLNEANKEKLIELK